ncbi:uncharacterized protein LOC121833454 [Ixodes scapularis]|uniref:Myb-like domain-containing protein n=1 Tax=Ixodes scapularis TaxID=6945 RepID=B7PLG0_IXOSC|nr:uncharacterized protein LOC8051823 [Ixodes scapularis]XP_042142702.1 uncharacterized protein LOC121833454 [Ixodes scapularis]EEC07432.1 hypothetical protein IscW_ISCW018692 [Ixodes scapularis]|eukprot:XP_002434608.1 hypothetical protein IscW_ISCW018692 [Ixodes scapularis]
MESSKPGLARLRTTPRRAPGAVGTQWGGTEGRSAPYSASEVDRLVELVADKAALLLSAGESGAKRACWDELARKMSRSADDVRRKWSNIVAEVKLPKRSSPFKPYELTALRLMGAERTPTPQLQIIPASVCSIPANSFLHQEQGVQAPAAAAAPPAAPSSLTIVALSNREVSITPVKRALPADSDESELQLVRVSQSVHTQTDAEAPKRARLDEAGLCARLVALEERRLALDRERLALDRDRLKCTQELVALLKTRPSPLPNGDLVASTLAASSL